MNAIKCLHCDAVVSRQEAIDGWCETCGKRLPSSVTAAARDRDRRRRSGNRPGVGWTAAGPGGSWVGVGGVLLGLGSCVALPLVWTWLPVGTIPQEKLDFWVGEVAAGAVFLALGLAIAWGCVRSTRR